MHIAAQSFKHLESGPFSLSFGLLVCIKQLTLDYFNSKLHKHISQILNLHEYKQSPPLLLNPYDPFAYLNSLFIDIIILIVFCI